MNFEEQIERLISAYSHSEEGIVKFRHRRLTAMLQYFQESGFPPPCSTPQLSLYPSYFQEANYDGIAWYDQNASLDHLEYDLEVDCMFQNEGKLRHQLSEIEFEKYYRFSSASIGYRPQKKQSFFGMLKSKFLGN